MMESAAFGLMAFGYVALMVGLLRIFKDSDLDDRQ